MLKKILTALLALSLCIGLAACAGETGTPSAESSAPSAISQPESVAESNEPETSEQEDTIPPAFLGATDGKLEPIVQEADEEISLTEGVVARDNLTPDEEIIISVVDLGGYDASVPGTYTLTIQAEDKAGNKATVTRDVTVKTKVEETVLTIRQSEIPYKQNPSGALSYTPSGTKFRSEDVIQILERDFFLSEYKAHAADHTNNGGVPFFPFGVLIVTDSQYRVVQIRISAGANIQLEQDGSITSDVNWTNAIDASSGGGLFRGFANELEQLIPDGGYVMMVGNPGEQLCRIFLIRNLFYSKYESGAVSVEDRDVETAGLRIVLE